MELSLSKQQAFELGNFLNVASKEFANITEARKASTVRTAFEKSIPEYYTYFKDLAGKNNVAMQDYRDKYQEFTTTKVNDVLPTQEVSQAKAVEFDKELRGLLKVIEDQAEAYKLGEGAEKVKIKLDKNGFDFLKKFFERKAVTFQLWQDTGKLEEIATLLDI